MRFPGIRLVEQTEQKFRRIQVCLKERLKKREVSKIVKGALWAPCKIHFVAKYRKN